jgi:hypothetical protein
LHPPRRNFFTIPRGEQIVIPCSRKMREQNKERGDSPETLLTRPLALRQTLTPTLQARY